MSKIITEQVTTTVYTTTDGKQFDYLSQAKWHQKELDAPKIYIVAIQSNLKAFSTLELAEKYASDYQQSSVTLYELPVDLYIKDNK